jgi:hypothetical protein
MIRSYGNTKVLDLLSQAVDIAGNGEAFHIKMMCFTQKQGFQGHKALNRFESSHDREWRVKMQNYSLDMFDETIKPRWDYSISEPGNLKAYLEAYLDWEVYVYSKLSAITYELRANGFPCEAELVKEGLPQEEIKYIRRMLKEYSLTGWDMAYILEQDEEIGKMVLEWEVNG